MTDMPSTVNCNVVHVRLRDTPTTWCGDASMQSSLPCPFGPFLSLGSAGACAQLQYAWLGCDWQSLQPAAGTVCSGRDSPLWAGTVPVSETLRQACWCWLSCPPTCLSRLQVTHRPRACYHVALPQRCHLLPPAGLPEWRHSFGGRLY
jgi:hypothetical protein